MGRLWGHSSGVRFDSDPHQPELRKAILATTATPGMSHSQQQRLLNRQDALRIMLKNVGDEPVWSRLFERDDEIFKDIFPTTWRELEKLHFIEPRHTLSYCYCL